MAVAGKTAPALWIRRYGHGLYVIMHAQNRLTITLVDDCEAAETLLHSVGDVWIPAMMRARLEEAIGRPIVDAAFMKRGRERKMPPWVNDLLAQLSEGNKTTLIIVAGLLLLALLIAGVIGYQFQLLPGILGQ